VSCRCRFNLRLILKVYYRRIKCVKMTIRECGKHFLYRDDAHFRAAIQNKILYISTHVSSVVQSSVSGSCTRR